MDFSNLRAITVTPSTVCKRFTEPQNAITVHLYSYDGNEDTTLQVESFNSSVLEAMGLTFRNPYITLPDVTRDKLTFYLCQRGEYVMINNPYKGYNFVSLQEETNAFIGMIKIVHSAFSEKYPSRTVVYETVTHAF